MTAEVPSSQLATPGPPALDEGPAGQGIPGITFHRAWWGRGGLFWVCRTAEAKITIAGWLSLFLPPALPAAGSLSLSWQPSPGPDAATEEPEASFLECS